MSTMEYFQKTGQGKLTAETEIASTGGNLQPQRVFPQFPTSAKIST